MTGYAAIFKHYDHWDNFVRLWKIGAQPDVSHMPEPGWGWHPAGNERLLNREYLLSNKEDVFEHTLCFAARASRLINTRLRNIVLVRAVYSKIREVVGNLISEPQAGAHNNLPCSEKLKEIINYIHKLKHTQ